MVVVVGGNVLHHVKSGGDVWGEYVTGRISPLTCSWPHLRCDVGLEEGAYK